MITQKIVEKVIGSSWASLLWNEFNETYMGSLQRAVASERSAFDIYPAKENVFKAFKLTPYDKLRVVILGQDPYHTPGMATGLAFSVSNDTPHQNVPPSLKNILQEVEDDLGFKEPYPEIDLTRWAKQGVLLLNRTLTVRAHMANSHKHLGWDLFTERVIREISNGPQKVVFLLWGRVAQEADRHIDLFNHWVIKTSHPSPFSSHQGFFGSKCFSKCNEFLTVEGLDPIVW